MLLSIIICTYNSKNKLPKTLDSILGQDFFDYEVIVIDGASTDGTVEIIKDYEQRFAGRLRWISEKDKGIYQAMNKGVKMAEGEFLNVVGAGDWLEKGALKAIGKSLKENHQMPVVYGKTKVWKENLVENRVVQTFPEVLPVQPMQHPAMYYQKKLHDKFGFYDENYRITADYLFCLMAFWQGEEKLAVLDQVVCNFVSDGISSKKTWLCLRENWRAKKAVGIKVDFLMDFLKYLVNALK